MPGAIPCVYDDEMTYVGRMWRIRCGFDAGSILKTPRGKNALALALALALTDRLTGASMA